MQPGQSAGGLRRVTQTTPIAVPLGKMRRLSNKHLSNA